MWITIRRDDPWQQSFPLSLLFLFFFLCLLFSVVSIFLSIFLQEKKLHDCVFLDSFPSFFLPLSFFPLWFISLSFSLIPSLFLSFLLSFSSYLWMHILRMIIHERKGCSRVINVCIKLYLKIMAPLLFLFLSFSPPLLLFLDFFFSWKRNKEKEKKEEEIMEKWERKFCAFQNFLAF